MAVFLAAAKATSLVGTPLNLLAYLLAESLCVPVGCILQEMRKEFLMLFIAIASHKLISGLALSSRFLKEGATTKQVRASAVRAKGQGMGGEGRGACSCRCYLLAAAGFVQHALQLLQ